MFIKNREDYILEPFQIRSIKIKFGDIRPKYFIVKIFIVLIVYYFRWQFLEAHFKLSGDHYVKVGKSGIENITMLKTIWLIG